MSVLFPHLRARTRALHMHGRWKVDTFVFIFTCTPRSSSTDFSYSCITGWSSVCLGLLANKFLIPPSPVGLTAWLPLGALSSPICPSVPGAQGEEPGRPGETAPPPPHVNCSRCRGGNRKSWTLTQSHTDPSGTFRSLNSSKRWCHFLARSGSQPS